MMKNYENIFIVRPDLAPSQVEAIAEKMSGIIAQHKGKVEKTEYCGLRQLAYEIKKNSKGHYVLLSFSAAPSVIAELEQRMRLEEEIMRFLTIQVEELEKGPSLLLQQSRNTRDSYRGGGGDYRARSSDRPARVEETSEAQTEKA
jgi:small subunit ribosomal protein S6